MNLIELDWSLSPFICNHFGLICDLFIVCDLSRWTPLKVKTIGCEFDGRAAKSDTRLRLVYLHLGVTLKELPVVRGLSRYRLLKVCPVSTLVGCRWQSRFGNITRNYFIDQGKFSFKTSLEIWTTFVFSLPLSSAICLANLNLLIMTDTEDDLKRCTNVTVPRWLSPVEDIWQHQHT